MGDDATLRGLWHDHERAAFPPDCVGREAGGRDLQMLATEVAGVVQAFVERREEFYGMEDVFTSTLQGSRGDLVRVVEELEGEAAEYFGRLAILSELVLGELGAG